MEDKVQRLGLTVLHEPNPATDAVVDIVFIPGLFGHPYKTWACKDSRDRSDGRGNGEGSSKSWRERLSLHRPQSPKHTKSSPLISPKAFDFPETETVSESDIPTSYSKTREVFWPRDLLPQVVPLARVLVWGYDVDITRLFSFASQSTVLQHAETLLSDLLDARQTLEERERNIIFVAHSLGGIVVKDASCLSMISKTRLSKILPATVGICFLGTPHRGSGSATVGKIAFEMSKIFYTHANTTILKTLENNAGILDRISWNFSQLLMGRELQIHSFRETLPTNGCMIVDAVSFSLGEGREIKGEIPLNHRDMTKFSSSKDVGYQRVSKVLAHWLREVQYQLRKEQDRRRCLESLNLPESRQRIATVDPTFAGTCEWLFDNKVKFADWLRRKKNNIYWIQGKPGSGKSTVMKLAMNHPKTVGLLHDADSKAWLVAGFFFHDRGFLVQKTVDGLLREILYQLLSKKPELFHLVQPIYVSTIKSRSPDAPEPRMKVSEITGITDVGDTSAAEKLRWTRESLRKALLAIVLNRRISLNICLFIDALDEHEGDHRNLLAILKDLVDLPDRRTVCVKLCLASRPENVFRDELNTYPGFAIHDYTKEDILIYASGRMRPELARRRLHKNISRINRLLQNILEMAQGVFIWVRLVVDELIEGLCEGDDIDDLNRILSTIPSELEGLYQRALSRLLGRGTPESIKERRTYEAFVMFQIALCCWQPYSLGRFVQVASFITDGTYGAPVLKEPVPTDDMKRRLTSRGGGLLECVSSNDSSPYINDSSSSPDLPDAEGTLAAFNRRLKEAAWDANIMWRGEEVVQFIHQTAKEFVLKESTASIFLTNSHKYLTDNGHDFIIRYCSYLLRDGQVSIVPEMLFQIWSSYKKSGKFHYEAVDKLTTVSTMFSFESWDPMRKGKGGPVSSGTFESFWLHMSGPMQRVLLISVCASLSPYVERTMPIITISALEATAIFYAALHSCFCPWPGGDEGDTSILGQLIERNLIFDTESLSESPFTILDHYRSSDNSAVVKRIRQIVVAAGWIDRRVNLRLSIPKPEGEKEQMPTV